MPLKQVVHLIRAHVGKDSLSISKAVPYEPIETLYQEIDQTTESLFGDKTIADLLETEEK
jgi:hypothetical protein